MQLATLTSRVNGEQLLLDCGLFQGLKPLRLRNWDCPPFDPSAPNAVVLSHGHFNHSVYRSLLVKRGFRGPILCTPATADLVGIVPTLQLYTAVDVAQTLQQICTQPYGKSFEPTKSTNVVFGRAGHILGAATVSLQLAAPNAYKLVFHGDSGRWGRPILRDPEFVYGEDIPVRAQVETIDGLSAPRRSKRNFALAQRV